MKFDRYKRTIQRTAIYYMATNFESLDEQYCKEANGILYEKAVKDVFKFCNLKYRNMYCVEFKILGGDPTFYLKIGPKNLNDFDKDEFWECITDSKHISRFLKICEIHLNVFIYYRFK